MSQLRDEGTGVSQGWQAQAAITKHQTGDLTGIYFSQSWGLRSPESRCQPVQAVPPTWEPLLLAMSLCFPWISPTPLPPPVSLMRATTPSQHRHLAHWRFGFMSAPPSQQTPRGPRQHPPFCGSPRNPVPSTERAHCEHYVDMYGTHQ